jgi:hypothetical protein
MTQAEIQVLASNIIGDGQSPNKWFVTQSAYVKHYVSDWEMDSKILKGFSDTDIHTQVFDSYEDALDAYDGIYLDPDLGIGSVMIEDREIGVVKEKWLTEKVVIEYVEDEHDDSDFYTK